VLVVVAVALIALTWTSASDGSASIRALDHGVGIVVLIMVAASLVLIQLRLPPAWTGPGFVVAALGRELFVASDRAGVEPGAGLWVGMIGAFAATGLLITDFFSTIGEADG